MARRKSRAKPRYFQGGAVPVSDEPLPGFGQEEPVASEAASADEPPPPQARPSMPPPEPMADDPVKRALEAQLRAEEMARQNRASADQPWAHLPQEWQEFFAADPRAWHDPARRRAGEWSYTNAVNEGVPENQRIGYVRGFLRHFDEMQQRQPIEIAKAQSEPPLPEPDLDRDAERAREVIAVEKTMELPEISRAPRKPSIPVGAPVSRDLPSYSGQRPRDSGKIVLSPEERDMARRSNTDPTISDEQKERDYALQKAKMLQMRKEGRLD